MNKKTSFQYIIAVGLISAMFIFIIGFGAMGLFWMKARTNYIGEKGFFYWRAATWGDGLCLPLLVGALCSYKVSLGEIKLKYRRISYLWGLGAGIIGVMVQASWIISDTTEPNWTIGHHYFEPSGWYHAGYFVFMFFAITTLLVQVFFARKQHNQNCEIINKDLLHMILLTLIWFSGLGYLFMHNIDNVYTSENYMLIAISTMLFGGISAFLFCYFSDKKLYTMVTDKQNKYWTIKIDMRSIIIGSLSAMGFGMAVYYREVDFVTAAMCAALSIIFVRPILEKPMFTIMNIFFVVLPTFLLTLATLETKNIVYMIFFALAIVFTPIFIAPSGNKYKFIGALTIILFLIPNIVSNISNHLEGVSELLNSIASAIIVIICSLYIPRIFRDSVIYEENKPKDEKSSGEVIRAIVISYIMMLFVTIPSIGMVVKSLYIAFSGYIKPGIELDYGFLIYSNNIVYMGVFIFSICVLIIICLFDRKRSKLTKCFAVFMLALAYLSIILNLISLQVPYFINSNNLLEGFIIWIILWASIFVAFGFYDNIIRIRGVNKKDSRMAWVGSVIIFGGCSASFILLTCSMNCTSTIAASVPRFLIGIFVIICCTMVLPTLCCIIVSFPKNLDIDITDNSPATGVMHVGFLMVFPIIIGVLSVLFIGSLVSTSIVEAQNDSNVILVLNFAIGCLTLISGFSVAIIFCLKNNVKHLEKRINENKDNEKRKIALYELSCHLRRQNIVVILMLAPYLFIPFLVKLLFTYIESDNQFKFTCRNLIKEYIPAKYDGV